MRAAWKFGIISRIILTTCARRKRRKSIRYHLSFCEACREQLDQWQSVREELRALPRRQVPPELALRLRVQMSQRLNQKPLPDLWVRFENALKPLAAAGHGRGVDGGDLLLPDHGIAGGSRSPTIPDVTVQLVHAGARAATGAHGFQHR